MSADSGMQGNPDYGGSRGPVLPMVVVVIVTVVLMAIILRAQLGR